METTLQPCFYRNRSATLLLWKPFYNPAFMQTALQPCFYKSSLSLALQLCWFKNELKNSAFMDTALALQLCCLRVSSTTLLLCKTLCNPAFMKTACLWLYNSVVLRTSSATLLLWTLLWLYNSVVIRASFATLLLWTPLWLYNSVVFRASSATLLL